MTIIPSFVYYDDKHLIKVTIELCKGKKEDDKRESIKKRDIERDVRREINN